MIDLGIYAPQSAIGPRSDPGEQQFIGRVTTTLEQWNDAVKWVEAQMLELHPVDDLEASFTVEYSHRDPAKYIARFTCETLNGHPVWIFESSYEQAPNGAEYRETVAVAFARLDAEVKVLHDQKML